MPRAPRSTLVQDLNPLRSDIISRLKKAEDQIAKLRAQAKEIDAALAQAEADHKVLVQLAKVAGSAPRGARGRARTAGGGSARRGSGERAKQLLKLLDGGKQLTKKELVGGLGVSDVRVQQLLTQLKKHGQIKSSPQPGSRRTLVWSLTAAGKSAIG